MTIHRDIVGRISVAAAAAALFLGTALTPALADESKRGVEQVAEATPVTIRFSWKLKGEYAPLYVAQEKGYFEKEGIKVTMGEGSGAQGALAAVEAGQETTTFAPAAFGLQAISKGLDVKIIALYHPSTPMVYLSRPENPIRTPKDMEGKKIAVSVGDTAADFLDVFCKANNVDCAKITKVQMNIKAMQTEFLAGHVDASSAYLTNDVPILRAKGEKLVLLDLTENGLNVPGGSLIASNKTIEEKGKALAGLLRALDKGYRDAKKDPLEAARIMKKYWDTSLSDEVVADQVRETVKAVPEYPGKPIGWIDEKVLAKSLEQMKDAGKIDKIQSPDAYSTNKLYGIGS